jgi:hypothetical protein
MTVCAAALLTSALTNAQTTRTAPPKKSEAEIQAAINAHKGDFDYLLGQWKFTAVNKQYGTLNGFWSAVKLPEGQLLDEYRIVDEKGETVYVTTTLRAYNAVLDQWELVGMHTGDGLNDTGSGRRDGAEMHIEQTFGVMSQQPATMRIRYFNIKADSFSWSADRTTDAGKTWVIGFQTIEAKRIASARAVQIFSAPPRR